MLALIGFSCLFIVYLYAPHDDKLGGIMFCTCPSALTSQVYVLICLPEMCLGAYFDLGA